MRGAGHENYSMTTTDSRKGVTTIRCGTKRFDTTWGTEKNWIEQTAYEITSWFKTGSYQPHSIPVLPSITSCYLSATLKDVRTLIEENDPEALEILEAIQEFQKENPLPKTPSSSPEESADSEPYSD